MNLILLAEGTPFHAPDAGHLFNYEPLSIGLTFPMLVMMAVTLLISFFFIAAFRKPKVIPVGAQNLGEMGIEFVEKQIMLPVMGPAGRAWMPLLTGIFFWVFFLNIMGIIPGIQFPITSRMAIPATLAVLVYFIYNGIGIKNQGFVGYLKGTMFPPGVPWPVYILLAPIEFFSTFIFRPLTLALRLFANMVAGHMLLAVIATATATFVGGGFKGILASVIPGAFGVIMTGFEIFVAFMQAFIITILTSVYIAGAQEAHH